jgi:hypothetical protein
LSDCNLEVDVRELDSGVQLSADLRADGRLRVRIDTEFADRSQGHFIRPALWTVQLHRSRGGPQGRGSPAKEARRGICWGIRRYVKLLRDNGFKTYSSREHRIEVKLDAAASEMRPDG